MNKKIFSTITIILMIILGFYINDANKKQENFISINDQIQDICLLNKEFDLYSKDNLSYDNFDIIQDKIDSFETKLYKIIHDKTIQKSYDKNLSILLVEIKSSADQKFKIIEKIKSYKTILNNSLKIIDKIKEKGASKDFDRAYNLIIKIEKSSVISIKNELNNINNLIPNYPNKYDNFFLRHSQIILDYYLKLKDRGVLFKKVQLDQQLNKLNTYYKNYAKISNGKAQTSIYILFFILTLFIIIYIVDDYRLKLLNMELLRFKKTVENSDNIVVVTDKEEKIKYVNDSFTKTTGYTLSEVRGKKPNVLKSGKHSKEFYDDLYQTIHSGKKWSGVFINIDKYEKLSYERASITPVVNNKGKIEEFIAIKLDITKETLVEEKLKEQSKEQEYILKDKVREALTKNTKQLQLLQQQSKMAQMGEMIGAIAHQWRQPLNTVSTSIQNLKYDHMEGLLEDKEFIKQFINKNKETIKFMSETIDDFRNFFRVDKKRFDFNVKDATQSTINMQSALLNNHNILLNLTGEEFIIHNLQSEYQQVILNIINNAIDVLLDNKIKKPIIDVVLENNTISIQDNAGGIPDNILDRVFEPYFTTKDQGKGTGMGLYISKMIIEDNMGGKLSVTNGTHGAIFKIDFEMTI